MQHGSQSQVRLTLIVGDESFNLAQIGPGYGILRHPDFLSPGIGVLVIKVDERIREWDVEILHAVTPEDPVVRFRRVSEQPRLLGTGHCDSVALI